MVDGVGVVLLEVELDDLEEGVVVVVVGVVVVVVVVLVVGVVGDICVGEMFEEDMVVEILCEVYVKKFRVGFLLWLCGVVERDKF